MSVEFLAELFHTIAERGRQLLGHSATTVSDDADPATLFESLLARRGEASSLALAEEVLGRWAVLDLEQRREFLRTMCTRFGVDQAELASAIDAYQGNPTDLTAQALHRAAEPRRQEIIRRLNMAPGGTAAIVEMRALVLDSLRQNNDLAALDADFLHLLSSWFNRGFLVLRRIDWSTAAAILEKIILYEAVHEINGWDDLRRRLEPPDRSCFAFFHPQLVDEPLIFVEVALTEQIPGAIAPLLAPDRRPIAAEKARTAVFYSISNTQRGLAGVSFGDFLIKQVVEELRRDLPQINAFVTLSPMPGFAAWLRDVRTTPDALPEEEIREALAAVNEEWAPSDADGDPLERPLLKAAAHYLLRAKTAKGLPIDPVARFHLRNGALVERINFAADLSKRGMDQAAGLMVNYLYDLDQIERNHEAFTATGEMAASGQVLKLLSP
jgi:malonyl-CoA decarboxylase